MTYALWKAELKDPTLLAKRLERSTNPFDMFGFWRIISARTKIDWPVAIWLQKGENGGPDIVMFKIGAGAKDGESLFAHPSNPERVADFLAGSWLDCVAVTEEEYHRAMDLNNRRWADGKAASKITAEQALDIIPDTPAEEGGNQEFDEDGNPIDGYHRQIDTKLAALLEKSRTFKTITTLEQANAAAQVREDIKKLLDLGEARRKAEKKPHDDAADAVQAKWNPTLKPASTAYAWLLDQIDAFKKAEKAKAEAKAREEARQAAAQAAAEAEERARAANPGATEEEIAETARQAADATREAVLSAPIEAPRVSTAYGKAQTKRKVSRGRITDYDAFLAVVKDWAATKEYFQGIVDKLARQKTPIAGVEFYEE